MSRLNRLVFLRKKYSNWDIAVCQALNVGHHTQYPREFNTFLNQYNSSNGDNMPLSDVYDDLLIKNQGSLYESI